jgi:lysophospholipase L1-like esterase
VIGISSFLITLLFGAGFVYAISDILYPRASSTLQTTKQDLSKKNDKSIDIIGIGDSLTQGYGDGAGKGYAFYLKELLAQNSKGEQVSLSNNYAINGARTSDLLKRLNNPSSRYSIAQADIIVMTIGGNDLFQIGDGEVDPAQIKAKIPAALEQLDKIFSRLNEMNHTADIYYVGLYNPFSDLENERESTMVLQTWNDAVFRMINPYPNMTFVPTYDLFKNNLKELLYSGDNYHPNQEGYKKIANRLYEVIR